MVSTSINTFANRFGMSPRELKRFIKFACVGVIGAVVDFGSFNVMLTMGIATTVANTISFFLAIISNFIWNRYWTYPDSRSKNLVRQFAQFFSVNASGLVIRWPIVRFGEAAMVGLVTATGLFNSALSARLGANLIVACAVGIVMFWNFFVNRYYTYNDVE